MTRYEFIVKGGKEEMAKAIAFCLTTYDETVQGKTYSCDDFVARINVAKEHIMPWLDAEVEDVD